MLAQARLLLHGAHPGPRFLLLEIRVDVFKFSHTGGGVIIPSSDPALQEVKFNHNSTKNGCQPTPTPGVGHVSGSIGLKIGCKSWFLKQLRGLERNGENHGVSFQPNQLFKKPIFTTAYEACCIVSL